MAALEHMAESTGGGRPAPLVESIVQSDQMGVPIARLLRVQATEMRRRQRQTAQERAAQASSRMVFPMVGCIFPVLLDRAPWPGHHPDRQEPALGRAAHSTARP